MSTEAPLTVEALRRLHETMKDVAHVHPPRVMMYCCPGEQDEIMALFRRTNPSPIVYGTLGHLDGVDFELRGHNFCKPGHLMIIRHPDDYEPFGRLDVDLVGGLRPGEEDPLADSA